MDKLKLIERNLSLVFNFRYGHVRVSCTSLITAKPGNTKGGSITVLLTSCLTVLDKSVLQIKTKIVSCHTAVSKPVKQEVNGTVMLPPFSIPWSAVKAECC